MPKTTVKKKRNIRANKRRGNLYEQNIAKELRELGFEGVKTSRECSKLMDDQKIDFVDTLNQLPCYIQAKRTIQVPDYFKIKDACPLKDKPFVIFWNKQKPTESTFRSVGEVVFIDKDFFYKLIKNYNG